MYHVELLGNPDYSFTVKSGDYQFTVDLKGEGISPPDTLLASLASCIGVYINKYCQGSNLKVSSFSINAEAELSKEKPVCFKQIKVSVDLKGAVLDERRKSALLEFIRNCPVHNTLHSNPAIDIGII
jgi:putative redox protein